MVVCDVVWRTDCSGGEVSWSVGSGGVYKVHSQPRCLLWSGYVCATITILSDGLVMCATITILSGGLVMCATITILSGGLVMCATITILSLMVWLQVSLGIQETLSTYHLPA
jgi:hypothetical protein